MCLVPLNLVKSKMTQKAVTTFKSRLKLNQYINLKGELLPSNLGSLTFVKVTILLGMYQCHFPCMIWVL